MHVWKSVKVFVSSTFKDLELERDRLAGVFNDIQKAIFERRVGLILYDLRWRQRHEKEEPVRWCLEMVEQCRYFIGILGYRYGWRPPYNDKGQLNKEEISITEMEIARALEVIPAENRLFFFGDFAQYSPAQIAEESERDLESIVRLKNELVRRGEKIFPYQDSQQVLAAIASNFRQIVDRDFPPGHKAPLEVFTRSQASREIIEEKTRVFVGRRKYLQLLHQFAASVEENYLTVHAVAGTGKSALLARFIKETEAEFPGTLVAAHYMAAGRQVYDMWLGLAEQLQAGGIISPDEPFDAETLSSTVREALENTDRQVLIVLDGLDEMDEEGKELAWFPRGLPKNIKILLAVRPVPPWPKLRELPAMGTLELPPLDTEEIAEIIEHYRRNHDLQMDRQDQELLLQRAAGNPLFLKVALDEILSTGMAVGQMATSVSRLFEQILDRLEQEYGGEIIATCLGVIAAGRSGVAEQELLDIIKSSHSCGDDLLLAVTRSLANFIIRRKNLLAFFHPEFERSIMMRLGKGRMRKYYRLLADYLHGKGYGYERALSELPYLELCAGRDENALRLLTDINFLQAKTEAGMANGLAFDFHHALYHNEFSLSPTLQLDLDGIEVSKETLRLLEKALNLDLQFVRNHPDKLFQCLWNRCYWHDTPEAIACYDGAVEPPVAIYKLMERWRQKWTATWLKSLRPLEPPLDSPLLKILRGHRDWVKCLAFSPDGQSFASGSRDRSLRLTHAVTGELLIRLRGHEGTVQSVAYTPDGSKVVSSSSDKTIRIWDAKTGKCLRVLHHEQGVESVAVTPDGERIISAGWECRIYIWDAASGECLDKLAGHEAGIESLSVTPDGSSYLSASRDGKVRVWDATKRECIKVLEGHADSVNAIAVSPDGKWMASASTDKTVHLRDCATWELRQVLTGHQNGVFALSFHPNGLQLVSGSSDRTLRIWDVSTGECRHTLTGHVERIFAAAYSPDGSRIISGGGFRDKTIRIWSVKQATPRRLLRQYNVNVKQVALDPEGMKSATGADDGSAAIWDLTCGRSIARLEGHQRKINKIKWSGSTIFTASQDKTARTWEAQTGRCLRVFKGHKGSVESLAVTNGMLITCSKDKTLRLWSLNNGECTRILTGHSDWVTAVDCNPGAKRIISGSRDNTARIWEATTGECLLVLSEHQGWVRDVHWHPVENIALTCSRDRTMKLWDGDNGKCLCSYEGHNRGIAYAAFTPDGSQIVSCSWDLTMRTWDTQSGKCLHLKKGWSEAAHMADERVKWTVINLAGVNIVEEKNSSGDRSRGLAMFPGMINQPVISRTGVVTGGSGDGYIYIVALCPSSPI